ncbi:MAG: cation:proton antiporter [Actinomycetota bacterium]
MVLEELAIVVGVVTVYAFVSKRLSAWSVSMPMVMVGAGWLLAVLDVVDAQVEREVIVVVAELTLAVILFGDAVRIDPARLRTEASLPVRLLFVGLPLSVLVGAASGWALLDGVGWAEAALLAAILAPTDAALGTAVVEDPAVPARERLALNVESGVNDGLAVPIVAIFTAIVLDEQRGTSEWTGFVVEQIGLGVVLGLVLGGAGIRLLTLAHRHGWSDGRYEQLATFLIPVSALLVADLVGGNSFIAAFVAGIAFGSGGLAPTVSHEEGRAAHFAEFTEDAAQLLAVVAFFLFGNVFVDQVIGDIDIRSVLLAITSLTVVRILPVFLALVGSGTHWQTRLFLGWFGPRGLASIVFGLLLLEEIDVESLGAIGDELFSVIALTVVASVVLHGVTAAPGARRYGAWASRSAPDVMAAGPEEHEMPRPRWR